jgi:hypothetical protein
MDKIKLLVVFDFCIEGNDILAAPDFAGSSTYLIRQQIQ